MSSVTTHPAPASSRIAPIMESPTGILPYQSLKNMIQEGEIKSAHTISDDQIQPASLDLRLGNTAYKVRASFLPGPDMTVMEKIHQLGGKEIDITGSAVLEKGAVYVIPLLESLHLKSGLKGFANPKSSIGRLDVFTRLITEHSALTNHNAGFDQVEPGYKGPLYVEVAPRTFNIVVRAGSRLNQIRFRRGNTPTSLAASELSELSKDQKIKNGLLSVSIDLEGNGPGSRIGYRARVTNAEIDVDKIGLYDPLDFWESIDYGNQLSIPLDPNDFYILATREAVQIPPECAAEMEAYDVTVGEFRVHYAGFFDPGFGWGTDSKAVLEVRSHHEVPFMLEHGQTIGWLRYEKIAGNKTDRLYGTGIGSNYQSQGLKLAKQFRQPTG